MYPAASVNLDVRHLTGQLVITNRLVRRVLLYALGQGYDPTVKKGQLNLRHAGQFISIEGAVRGR